MKKIYIILTYTGTILSQIIKNYTKDEFAHVSIALDEDLTQMYSFGRLNAYNPFIGSFVHEGIDIGTFKRFKRTRSRIYSLQISDEKYKKLQKIIQYFENNKEKYKFNLTGLACVGINIRIMRKNNFYCAEFVKHVMKSAGITGANQLPQLIRPDDFKKLPNLEVEYEGLLRKYKR